MQEIEIKIGNVTLCVSGNYIECDESVGFKEDFEIFDITHKDESVFDIISSNMVLHITDKCIELSKEFQESEQLKED